MKTPEELAISMWNKGGHGLDLEEVVAIITADRKDLMSEVVERLAKEVERHSVYPMTPEQEQQTFVEGIIFAQTIIKSK